MQRPLLHELHDVEQWLNAIYSEQKLLYGQLVEVTLPLREGLVPDAQTDSRFAQMHVIMDRIGALDREAAEIKDDWRQRGGAPGPQLATTLREVEQLILVVMERIKVAEKSALESKARLAPQLSAESRRRQMSAAYGAVSRTD